MNSIKFTLLLILVCIISTPMNAYTQSEELIPIPNVELESTTQIPNPLDLNPNWWHYFDLQNIDFSKNVSDFLSQLKDIISNLEDKHKIKSSEYEAKIYASLNALEDLKNIEQISPTEKSPIQDEYSLDELQNIERSLREAELIYNIQAPQLKDDQKAIKALAQKIDTLFAAYRKIDTANHEKLAAGMEIIANRLAWMVSTNKQPIQKLQIDNYKNNIEWLKEEKRHALNNLSITKNEYNKIQGEIEKQLAVLDIAQKNLVEAKSQTLEIVEDGLINTFKSNLLKQKALLAEIQTAHQSLRLHLLQAKQSISQLVINEPGLNLDEQIQQYKAREVILKNTKSEYDSWNKSFQKDRDLINELMLDRDSKNENYKTDEQILREHREVLKNTSTQLRNLDISINDLSFLNDVVREQLAKTQGLFFRLRSDSYSTIGGLWQSIQNVVSKSLFTIGDVPVTFTDILRAIIIILIAYVISRVVRRILRRISFADDSRSTSIIYTLSRLSHYLIIIIGLIIALSSIGLSFTNVAIVAGALSVGIGFGLQSIVNNFVSGIILLFEQNLKVGDYVELESGMKGVVKGIHVRSTTITTLDNLDIIVPNSELVAAKVTNYTLNEPMFRMHVPFGVAYGSDKDLVRKAVLEATRQVGVTYDDGAKRRPQVWLVGFGDSSLNFELVVWVVNKKGSNATPGSWRALYTWEIETALIKHGIEIPFPQRDLHLKSGFST